MLTFFLRYRYFIKPLVGLYGGLTLYFFVRFLESHWFIWCTQFNHLGMEMDVDDLKDWPARQAATTANADEGLFMDWFLGHMNFQIEHHFFPTMPRHNYPKVRPYAKAFCAKHGLKYTQKPFLTAVGDMLKSLEESGNIWKKTWEMSKDF